MSEIVNWKNSNKVYDEPSPSIVESNGASRENKDFLSIIVSRHEANYDVS